MPLLDWDERQTAIARLALSQLSYTTDTGTERGEIAAMLADLNGTMPRYTTPRTAHCESGALAVTNMQAWVIVVEVGIIALAYLVGLFRGRAA